jgi:hypothetical protein
MPDGRPVPAVMLEAELIKLLRLDELGVKNPENTLRYYRETHKLCPTRISGKNVYTVSAVMEFLDRLTKKSQETG